MSAFLPDCSKKVLDALHVNERMFKDTREFYNLTASDVVDELGILFPRIDLDKEFAELAEIMETK